MIIVTGGAGFIGSNLVKALNKQGRTDILVVDDLTDGQKFENLVDCEFTDYQDKITFIEGILDNLFDPADIEVIFHQGACSDTTELDGNYMMQNNFEYSKQLLHYCLEYKIPFLYASSAAVYGKSEIFAVDPQYEKPINVYGFSKWQFDQYVRATTSRAESQVVGLRYFNIYGPREQHKGKMASVAFHHYNEIRKTGKVKLFGEFDGYAAGEQKRDFVYIDDVIKVNLWFWNNPKLSGIFNLGTGQSQPFNDIANNVITYYGKGEIEYIPFPHNLKRHYQSFTEAHLEPLRKAGYREPFKTVAEGVKTYLDWLTQNKL